MFATLEQINDRPRPFEFYTAADLWTDEHTAGRMLACHLDDRTELASRPAEFIDLSVEWMTSHFGIGAGTRIVDFGCGPGLYANRLAGKGAAVLGVDFSESSVRFARDTAARQGLAVDYVVQNYLEFDSVERFDLVLMIWCDFCALSPAQRKHMLAKFCSLLEPGGAVLLDVHSLNAFARREESATYGANLLDGFWSAEPYYGFLNTFKYEEEHVVLDKYTIVEPDRMRTVYNWLQHFSPESLEAEFRESGLEVTERHADVAGAPFDSRATEFAVVARKPWRR